jgi:hypothetical protein
MQSASRSAELQACIVDCLACYRLCRRQAADDLMNDCAEMCRTAADFMLRSSAFYPQVCALCADICEACAQSCEGIGTLEACAYACRGCAQSCRRLARG